MRPIALILCLLPFTALPVHASTSSGAGAGKCTVAATPSLAAQHRAPALNPQPLPPRDDSRNAINPQPLPPHTPPTDAE